MATNELAVLLKAVPILGVASTLLALAWISLGLRLWTRARIVKNMGYDDWTIIIATGIFTGLCIELIRLSALELSVNLVEHFPFVANVRLWRSYDHACQLTNIASTQRLWSLYRHHHYAQDITCHFLPARRQ